MISIKRFLQVVGLALATVLCTHILLSLALVYLTATNFDVRGPNLRNFDFNMNPPETNATFQFLQPQRSFEDSLELYSAYLRNRWSGTSEAQRVLFLGSSVTWGYPMQASASLPGSYQALVGSEHVIASAAIIGGGLHRTMQIGCAIATAPQAGMVYLEIPVQNEVDNLLRNNQKYSVFRGSDECEELSARGDTTYLDYFLRTPFGLSMLSRVQPQYPHVTGAAHMHFVTIPDSYLYTVDEIDEVKREAIVGLDAAFAATQSVGDKVVAFVSPVYLDGYSELDINPDYLRHYADIAMRACRRHDDIICLNTLDLFAGDVEMFYNVTHLNRSGTRALADFLHAATGNTASTTLQKQPLKRGKASQPFVYAPPAGALGVRSEEVVHP